MIEWLMDKLGYQPRARQAVCFDVRAGIKQYYGPVTMMNVRAGDKIIDDKGNQWIYLFGGLKEQPMISVESDDR